MTGSVSPSSAFSAQVYKFDKWYLHPLIANWHASLSWFSIISMIGSVMSTVSLLLVRRLSGYTPQYPPHTSLIPNTPQSDLYTLPQPVLSSIFTNSSHSHTPPTLQAGNSNKVSWQVLLLVVAYSLNGAFISSNNGWAAAVCVTYRIDFKVAKATSIDSIAASTFWSVHNGLAVTYKFPNLYMWWGVQQACRYTVFLGSNWLDNFDRK